MRQNSTAWCESGYSCFMLCIWNIVWHVLHQDTNQVSMNHSHAAVWDLFSSMIIMLQIYLMLQRLYLHESFTSHDNIRMLAHHQDVGKLSSYYAYLLHDAVNFIHHYIPLAWCCIIQHTMRNTCSLRQHVITSNIMRHVPCTSWDA